MSKVSGKRLANLAAKIVKLDPEYAIAKAGKRIRLVGWSLHGDCKQVSLVFSVSDITALAASVLSQAERVEKKSKKTRVRK